MNEKIKKLSVIASQIFDLYNSERLESAMRKHYTDLKHLYKSNPNHFKFLFQNDRFILSTYLAVTYYTDQNPSIAKVKRKCLSLNILSSNTIYSLFDYFIVSDRIKTFKDNEDKRTCNFYFTHKGEMEIIELINVMIPAVKLLREDFVVKEINDNNYFLEKYFYRYATVVELGYVFFTNVKYIDLFISKDAGHLILMNLYFNQDKNGSLNISILQLSKNCHVSRNHIRSIIDVAVSFELIEKDYKYDNYMLTPAFNEMFKHYMATYFVCVMYGLGLYE